MRLANMPGLRAAAFIAAVLALGVACSKKSSSSAGSSGTLSSGQQKSAAVAVTSAISLVSNYSVSGSTVVSVIRARPLASYACPSGGQVILDYSHQVFNSTTSAYGGYVAATLNNCVIQGATLSGSWNQDFAFTWTSSDHIVFAFGGYVQVPSGSITVSGDGYSGSCVVTERVAYSNASMYWPTYALTGSITGTGGACGYSGSVACNLATGACQ